MKGFDGISTVITAAKTVATTTTTTDKKYSWEKLPDFFKSFNNFLSIVARIGSISNPKKPTKLIFLTNPPEDKIYEERLKELNKQKGLIKANRRNIANTTSNQEKKGNSESSEDLSDSDTSRSLMESHTTFSKFIPRKQRRNNFSVQFQNEIDSDDDFENPFEDEEIEEKPYSNELKGKQNIFFFFFDKSKC